MEIIMRKWKVVSLIVVSAMLLTAGLSFANYSYSYNNWKEIEGDYIADSAAVGIIHEDLYDFYYNYVESELEKRDRLIEEQFNKYQEQILKTASKEKKLNGTSDSIFVPNVAFEPTGVPSEEEIIEKASRELIPRTFAYNEGQMTELDKSIKSITIDDNEFLFQIFEHNGRKIIQPKVFTATPEIIGANNGERYIIPFYNESLYSVDPSSFHAEKITLDTIDGFTIGDFFEISPHVFWASLPSLNPSGSHLVYYSNKSTFEGKPKLLNGLWLYSFDDKAEKQILSDNHFEGNYFIAPQTYWVTDEEFMFMIVGEGQTKYFKYNMVTEDKKVIHESSEYSNFGNGFILSRKGNDYIVYDVENEAENAFSTPGKGMEGNVPFSPSGKVAISYGQKVMILNHKTGKSTVYTAPVNAIFTPISWINDDVLILSADINNKLTTWTLSDGGVENE